MICATGDAGTSRYERRFRFDHAVGHVYTPDALPGRVILQFSVLEPFLCKPQQVSSIYSISNNDGSVKRFSGRLIPFTPKERL